MSFGKGRLITNHYYILDYNNNTGIILLLCNVDCITFFYNCRGLINYKRHFRFRSNFRRHVLQLHARRSRVHSAVESVAS